MGSKNAQRAQGKFSELREKFSGKNQENKGTENNKH